MSFKLSIPIVVFFLFSTSIFADKIKRTDPMKDIQSNRNIDIYKHFISVYGYKNDLGIQYQNLILPNLLVGVELKYSRGYERANSFSKIPNDLNHSGNVIPYQYSYQSQIRYPFAGIQSRDDVWNFAAHVKYLLWNTPFYLNAKVSKNLKGGEFRSQEILYSDIGYSPFCPSSGLEGSCVSSNGSISPGSLDIHITEIPKFSFYGGFGLFLISKIGVYLQLELNYLVNSKNYKVDVSNNYFRASLPNVQTISPIDIFFTQKFLENKFPKTSRWEPIFYIGYAWGI
jgi:hypothetical protein